MMSRMYQVKRPSRSEFIPIRNLSYHVQIWGTPSPAKTPLVLVHGWMDVAASYQLVVDA
jgi:alpha-beta hydrolase superfamily lysophospholipase